MNFLRKLASEDVHEKGTTRNFFIGTPEAEGETTYNSKISSGKYLVTT